MVPSDRDPETDPVRTVEPARAARPVKMCGDGDSDAFAGAFNTTGVEEGFKAILEGYLATAPGTWPKTSPGVAIIGSEVLKVVAF